MDPKLRRVTQLPLRELWDDEGAIPARKGRILSDSDVRDYLRRDEGPLVVALFGTKVRWLFGDERFDEWKSELRERLVAPADAVHGYYEDDFPDGSYIAYEWTLDDGRRIVAFEGAH
jgi:hypothetical protein